VPTLNVSVATTTTTKTPTATSGPTSANITIGQTSSGKVLECTVTKANLSWTAQTGEVNYNLRVDDKANVWSGQCGAMNSGDLCWDGYRGVGTVPYVVKSGHTYSFWVDAPSLGQSRRVDFSVASCPNVNILNID
jgi:hypothetical protein